MTLSFQIDWLSMDSMPPMAEVSHELARESLIAISQTIPGKNLTSPRAPVDSTNVQVASTKDSEAEKYRSKLISISYTQSPDVEQPPYSP